MISIFISGRSEGTILVKNIRSQPVVYLDCGMQFYLLPEGQLSSTLSLIAMVLGRWYGHSGFRFAGNVTFRFLDYCLRFFWLPLFHSLINYMCWNTRLLLRVELVLLMQSQVHRRGQCLLLPELKCIKVKLLASINAPGRKKLQQTFVPTRNNQVRSSSVAINMLCEIHKLKLEVVWCNLWFLKKQVLVDFK
jgi:hypothetical protein